MEEKYTSERKNDNIDIVALWRAACRKWYLFAGSVVVCVALVVCYLKIAKPVYEVSADILVNEDEKKRRWRLVFIDGGYCRRRILVRRYDRWWLGE